MVYQGKTLLEHGTHLIEQLALEPIISGPGFVADQPAIKGIGPLAGISSAMAYRPDSDFWLILPVDMPLLIPELIQPLIGQQQSCFYQGYALPCLIRTAPSVFGALNQVLNMPDPKSRSIKNFLKQIQAIECPVPEAMACRLMNVNSPQDWAELESQYGA